MNINKISIFKTLTSAMSYHGARGKLVASNIANVDTPGFVPRDIADGSVAKALRSNAVRSASGLVRTDARHLPGVPDASRAGGFSSNERPDSETTLDGNAVVLEEQMARLGEVRMAHDAAIGLYQKSLGLLRLAVKRPGM
jgi:flagellar basal-body rod protein FlgB